MSQEFSFDVFISHSSEDKTIIRTLAERLRRDGLRVWFDEWEIHPGDSIPEKVEDGLERSRVLLLCMSAHAFGSDWAKLEAGTFRFRDPLNRERRLVPLRLDTSSIKGSLTQFLYIDWLPSRREQEYPKLLEACRLSSKSRPPEVGTEGKHSAAESLLEIPYRAWLPERQPPGALLRPDCAMAVPFHGRKDTLEDLEAWCADKRTLSIRLYTSAGGMGKTRLFIQLCNNLKQNAWTCGFLRTSETHFSNSWPKLLEQSSPILIIIDYAETRYRDLIPLLVAAATVTTGRVRIVLLARSAGDWWTVLKRTEKEVGDLLESKATRLCAINPLASTAQERLESWQSAARAFAQALSEPVPLKGPENLNDECFDRVLLLHVSALASIQGVEIRGEQGLLDYMLSRERRFWQRRVEKNSLEPAIAQAMAVITLGGGVSDAQRAREVLKRLPLLSDQTELVRERVAMLLHDTYPGNKWIDPLLPDLLGEHLVQQELQKNPVLLDIVLPI